MATRIKKVPNDLSFALASYRHGEKAHDLNIPPELHWSCTLSQTPGTGLILILKPVRVVSRRTRQHLRQTCLLAPFKVQVECSARQGFYQPSVQVKGPRGSS